jgi:hypothetical protein
MRGSDPNDRLFGEYMMGLAKHFLGDQTSAWRTHYAATDHRQNVIRFQDDIRFGTDLRVSARVFLARLLWLQGFSDQAVPTAEMSIGEAQGEFETLDREFRRPRRVAQLVDLQDQPAHRHPQEGALAIPQDR